MIINWVATKAQQFLAVQDAGLDELNGSFDFALSPEIMNLLYAQNAGSIEGRSGSTTPRIGEVESRLEQRARAPKVGDAAGAVAEAGQQAEDVTATAITQFALDEHELALA